VRIYLIVLPNFDPYACLYTVILGPLKQKSQGAQARLPGSDVEPMGRFITDWGRGSVMSQSIYTVGYVGQWPHWVTAIDPLPALDALTGTRQPQCDYCVKRNVQCWRQFVKVASSL